MGRDDESLKMIRNSRENLPSKQEGSISNSKAQTSSRLWSGLKDSRIVRVSRSFGGKDRHSKVSTIRGLRDRRVRLSVPTAIQLYDLQDRLGLNQPSKVVDWLLIASQHEIDKLPPLQFPPGNFLQFPQSMEFSHEATPPQAPSSPPTIANSEYFYNNCPSAISSRRMVNGKSLNNDLISGDLTTLPKSTYWNSDVDQRTKHKETMSECRIDQKGNNIKGNEVGDQGVGIHGVQVLAQDPSQRTSHSSLSTLLNSSMPYTSYYQWEPSNAYVSHLQNHSFQSEVAHNYQPISLPSSLPLMPGSQLVMCPSGTVPSMFPTSPIDFDTKQLNHFQMTSSASQNLPSNSPNNVIHSNSPVMTPFNATLTSKLHHSQNHNEGELILPTMRTNSIQSGASTTTTFHKDFNASRGLDAASFM